MWRKWLCINVEEVSDKKWEWNMCINVEEWKGEKEV